MNQSDMIDSPPIIYSLIINKQMWLHMSSLMMTSKLQWVNKRWCHMSSSMCRRFRGLCHMTACCCPSVTWHPSPGPSLLTEVRVQFPRGHSPSSCPNINQLIGLQTSSGLIHLSTQTPLSLLGRPFGLVPFTARQRSGLVRQAQRSCSSRQGTHWLLQRLSSQKLLTSCRAWHWSGCTGGFYKTGNTCHFFIHVVTARDQPSYF